MPPPTKRENYRKLAFLHYKERGQIMCAHCGFGIVDVLEVAHLDCDRSNNKIDNLAILCPTCHRMYDLDLITLETILVMRDRPKVANWAKLMKDAGAKAAKTRTDRAKWKTAGKKAAATRKRNAEQNLPTYSAKDESELPDFVVRWLDEKADEYGKALEEGLKKDRP